MINNDADDSIVWVFVFWFSLCLLAQLLLRSQLCNLIMYDKISIIVFTIPIFWKLYLHVHLYMHILYCEDTLDFFDVWPGLATLQSFANGSGCGCDFHGDSFVGYPTIFWASACPWSLVIKFSFSRNNKGWYFSLHYRRAATRLTLKDSMTNSKRKRGI